MAEGEKRGPVEKGEKGWPVNPIGALALFIFALVVIFLIVKPLISPKTPTINEQLDSKGGHIISPNSGDVIKSATLPMELSVDQPQNVDKVQFWLKTYADGKWTMAGEVTTSPYKLDWQIPAEFKNKAVAITAHIITKDAKDIKDPGGWREGIIIISQ